jgi:hypothetical protein
MNARSLILATLIFPLSTGLAPAAGGGGKAAPVVPGGRTALDVPAGTEVQVQGKIVRADAAGCKELEDQYVLEISRVNGQDLPAKRIFQFRTAKGLAPKIAGDIFELHQLKTGKIADEIPWAQVVALEKAYLGHPVEFVASELEGGAVMHEGKALPPVLLLAKCLKAP